MKVHLTIWGIFLMSISMSFGQVKLLPSGDFSIGNEVHILKDGDVGIGTTMPVEKVEVAGNIALSSAETGGTTVENRNHLIYGIGGKKRLMFSSNSTSQNSWAWINMFGDESCVDCEIAKKGNLSMAGQQIFIRTNNTGSNYGTVAVEIKSNQDMYVTGDIYSGGNLIGSDRRLKRSITDFNLGLKQIRKIEPKSYYYNGNGGLNSTHRPHVGVIAQDFQKIVPDHVLQYTFNDPILDIQEQYLAVDEGIIKFMLINAVKEMADEIDQLKQINQNIIDRLLVLENQSLNRKGQVENDGNSSHQIDVFLEGPTELPRLDQNRPNPFTENTTITYFIPKGHTGSHLIIKSSKGQELKTIQINEIGQGQIDLRTRNLAAGTYYYQLVTDQGVIGSKAMIVID